MLSDSQISATVKTASSKFGDEVLYKPLYIQVQKSRPTYVYPLIYEQDFPFYAKETVIDKGTFKCKAELNDETPTCGW
jgi:hypothetical protein